MCSKKMLSSDKEQKFFEKYGGVIKISLSTFFLIFSLLISDFYLKLAFSLLSFLICGVRVIINSVKGVIKGEFFDENTLMLIASVLAMFIGELFEGALIVILFSVGELLEEVASDCSKKRITGLIELKSVSVRLISKTGVSEVDPYSVEVGSIIEIRKGDRVPIDGVILTENAFIDAKAITGESRIYELKSGDTVYSGSINLGEVLRVKTTKLYKDSTAEKIIELVLSATDKKSKSQKFISSFAKVYTPVVVGLGVIIGGIIPLFFGLNFSKWIYTALNFLVVSCPCALVISVPLGYFIGIGSLSKMGILVKGSTFIDKLASCDAVVFDKTGTLTKGEFEISDIDLYKEIDKDELYSLIYALEIKSSHPISRVLTSVAPKTVYTADGVKEIEGQGITGNVEKKEIAVGNKSLVKEFNVNVPKNLKNGTSIFVLIDRELVAVIYLKDALKENAKNSISRLKGNSKRDIYLISGDAVENVKEVANYLGIDKYFYGMLPHEKSEKLSEIIKNSVSTAFVGDGINDAPSLALSDVGIAMGGLGSEIAIESADVVIMDDNLEKIADAIKISKKIKRKVVENIVASLSVKFFVMTLSLFFPVPIYLAMFADVGIMILAVLNSLSNFNLK